MSTIASEVPSTQSIQADPLVHGVSAVEIQALTTKCLEARETAYCPYSLFRVGCAILLKSSSTIITGANVENASYPVGTCAERVAMGSAVVLGHRLGSIKAVAVATDMDEFCSPCGMCRQFLREFCELDMPIFMHNAAGAYEVKTMGELLPMSFGPEALPARDVLEARMEEKPKTA